MKEREIDLIDLLAEVLLHWRMIILCMLVGGIALGLVPRKESREEVTDGAALERDLSEQEMRNVNWVIAYEKAYRTAETYLEKSALMKIDSSQVCKAEATMAIVAGDRQKSDDIGKVYEDIAQSGGLMERVAKDAGIEMTGIEDMILLSSRPGSIIMTNGSEGINTFRITVKHADEKRCKQMLESAIAFLREKKPDIEGILGQHELAVANESFAIMADAKIAERQKSILNDAAAMKQTLSNVKKELSDVEQQYYASLTDHEETEQASAAETAAVPGINVKYVLLGAVLAAFLYTFVIFLAYIFDAKIRVTDSLQELYDIPQLGMIPAGKGSKKTFHFIDRWILSLRDRNKRQFTPEEALELASAAVKMSAGKEGLQEISLIGCGLKERSLEASERIREYLEKDGIRVKILNNVLYDAQTMEELEDAKGVVLAESIGVTLYSEITKELELLRRQGITVLGGILLE